MKDNTVTIHPTVKLSTAFAIELMAEDKKMPIGKMIEILLEKDPEFIKKKRIYYNYKKS